jgi:hypothetical protein
MESNVNYYVSYYDAEQERDNRLVCISSDDAFETKKVLSENERFQNLQVIEEVILDRVIG